MPALTSAETSELVAHGCGHNLIAISNIGAFLVAAAQATATALRERIAK